MSELRVVRTFRSELLAADAARTTRRFRRGRAVVVAVATLLLALGIATIATGSFPLSDLLPSWLSKHERAKLGLPVSSSARILRIRTPDPAGGPPWGVRVSRTSRGATCQQVGRVKAGRFGFVDRHGAFQEAPLGLYGCDPPGISGAAPRPRPGVGIAISGLGETPASGAPLGGYSRHPCLDRALTVRETFDAHALVCDAPPMRWVSQGTVGRDVVAVEVRGPGIHERYPIVDGRYLIVRKRTPSGWTGAAVFRNGRREVAWGVGGAERVRRDHALVTQAGLRARPKRVGRSGLVTLSLNTPVSGDPARDGYDVSFSGPRGCANQHRVFFTVLPPPSSPRSRVTFGMRPPAANLESPRAWCRGRYTGRVMLGVDRLLGRFAFDVH